MSLEQKQIINQFVAEFGFDPFSSSGRQDKLRETAQAIVDRWDSPAWGGSAENLRHTGEYIAELRAALAQQDAQAVPQHLADDERVAALCDLSYVAGMKAGWNFCISDDSDGFERRQNSVGEAIRILQSHRAPTPSQQDAQAVPQGWIPPSGLKIADIGFRWDSDALQHVPHVLVEFEPVPANLPNTEKGWADRDAFVEMLNAAPTESAQRVMLTDEEIRDLWSWSMTAEAERTASTQQHAFARAVIEAYERKNGKEAP